jgi:hypothetical protein
MKPFSFRKVFEISSGKRVRISTSSTGDPKYEAFTLQIVRKFLSIHALNPEAILKI